MNVFQRLLSKSLEFVLEMIERWMEWPAAGRWVSAVLGISFLTAFLSPPHDRHPAAAFGESLKTLTLH